jgi:isochorismate pyruvate lyase
MPARAVIFLLLVTALAAPASAQEASPPAFWGQPSVDGGKCCQSLSEVRQHIDALDAEIIKLMAERQKYVTEAGRFKKDPASVSAPARVEAIIVKVRASAEAAGLSPDVAERAYRAMISGFEDYERSVWLEKNPAK